MRHIQCDGRATADIAIDCAKQTLGPWPVIPCSVRSTTVYTEGLRAKELLGALQPCSTIVARGLNAALALD